jgi:uncharacterized protein
VIRLLFAAFVLLALLGDARIFLFILNRFVFGSHREEKSPWTFLIFTVPPLLLALTLLFRPLGNWLDRLGPLEEVAWPSVGAAWLLVAASVGALWIVERIHALMQREQPLSGVETAEPRLIRMRRAHLPFESLQKLGAHNDILDIEVTHHEIFIDDLPRVFEDYRIAFLTDTHVARIVRADFYRECVRQASAFDPHLVLFGGDFVTFHRHIPLAAELLTADLRARDGAFAVRGNHDIWAGPDELEAALAARGVEFLTNRSIAIRRGDKSVHLAGIDEIYRGAPDIAAAFADVDPSRPCIVVSHHPDIVDELADRRIDLLLCGHTHGGQIRLPFFGPIVVPSRHEALYASGFHRVRNALLYVSRGIGAIPPLRILCRPEVATFTLRRGTRT